MSEGTVGPCREDTCSPELLSWMWSAVEAAATEDRIGWLVGYARLRPSNWLEWHSVVHIPPLIAIDQMLGKTYPVMQIMT